MIHQTLSLTFVFQIKTVADLKNTFSFTLSQKEKPFFGASPGSLLTSLTGGIKFT